MADKDFMGPPAIRGGTIGELRRNAYVAKGVTENLPPMAVPKNNGKPDFMRGSNDKVGPTTYPHDTKNSTPTGDTYSLKFQPNVLDNYDTYTYHWKLFITSLKDAYSGRVLETASQTIIAESGVSDLTIDKVELHGIAVPSVESGTGTQTILKFEIVEPSGAGLLDKMFYESLSLGIGNWLVMPCFLQLEFRGRDPVTGESVENGAPDGLGSLKWVWPIKITNSKANVTHVGTRYEFDAIIYDELAQSNSYFCIQHNTVLTGLDKFGKAMSDLQDKLNADQYEKLIDNYSIPDTYKIVVDPKLANINLVLSDANKHTSRGSDFIDFDKKTATYNTGTGIDKIVDSLLSSTDFFQKKLQSAQTRTSEPDTANQATPMRKFWRIITETKPIAFDMLRQDNAVEITIYVVEYDLGVIETTPSQTGQTPASKQAAVKRMATYSENKILKKKYNYIFTGLNDQIISFDLNMNFSFAASLSRFGGIYYDTAASDKGVSQQEAAKNEAEASEKVRQVLRFVNNPANSANADIELAAAQESIKNTNIDPALKRRYANILSHAKPTERKAYTTQIQNAGGVDADGELNRNVIYAKSLAGTVGNGLKFVSDVNIYSPEAKEAKRIAEDSRRGKLRPIPFRESSQEINAAYGIDPSSDAARARTASVFSTALYSTLDASLMMIKLTVKGDPFWLFPNKIASDVTVLPYKSNLGSDAAAINAIKNSHITNPESVNLFGTDNFIVVRFRTPRIYNETTGVTDPYTEVETFSGVYRVITITSKFEMGKFVQELTCNLDPLINLADFPQLLRDIEDTSKVPDPTLTSIADNKLIPTNAIKTARLSNPINAVSETVNKVKGQAETIRDKLTGKVEELKTTAIGTVKDAVKSNIPSSESLKAQDFLARIAKPTQG
jgi:hypothetical protein